MNIYDDEHFFRSYIELRSSANYNDILETPAILSLIGDVKGKRILDIGCGFGKTDAALSDAGASFILGIDISEKMIGKAREENSRGNIEYRVLSAEDISSLDGSFDIVMSSLCFHYIKDLSRLLSSVHSLLSEHGILAFSTEHPLTTASYDGHYMEDSNGWSGYCFSDYGREGKRESLWFERPVTTYHRMFSTVVNSLLDNGFTIKGIVEPLPDDEALGKIRRMIREYHKPSFIIIKAERI